ncbi:hypothetical protein EXS61_00240 [Candidatus Parcubacteria bacterium]|nr:hypothetical protein [Candidatus Parcubacteria bacterium]
MKINTKAKNITISAETSDYLIKKLATLDKIVNDDEMLCEVELGRESMHHANGDVFRAEINCSSKGKNYFTVATEQSLHGAIDIMKDELLREIKSYKSRQKTLLRRGGAKIKNILKGLYPFKKSR